MKYEITLNQINQENLDTAGKIGQAKNDSGKDIILYSFEDFNPESMEVYLPLKEIATYNEAILVRKEIEWLESDDSPFMQFVESLSEEDIEDMIYTRERYISLNQLYRNYLESISNEIVEILND